MARGLLFVTGAFQEKVTVDPLSPQPPPVGGSGGPFV
jgi:hypothetical protein